MGGVGGGVGHALDPLNHLNGWGGGGSKVQFKASWVRAMGGGVWACTEAKQCKNTPIQGEGGGGSSLTPPCYRWGTTPPHCNPS